MKQILSLGGGVQSTALLLMSEHGEIDRPCEAAIFADTGWEREETYNNIKWLKSLVRIPIYTVKNSNIRKDTIKGGFIEMPVFSRNKQGKVAMNRRQCTWKYKIKPTNQLVRELTKPTTAKPTQLWLGFSTDEAHRMRRDRYKSILNRYPLIEKRITRAGCYEWLKRNGYKTPVKSACIGCPMHNNESWRQLSDQEIEDASKVEKSIQSRTFLSGDTKPYLHPSLKPISERPFAKPNGQLEFDEMCDGNCFT